MVLQPPELPFEPDPGSISGWVLLETVSMSKQDIVDEYKVAEARYQALPDEGEEKYDSECALLAEDCLVPDDLACFLTTTTNNNSPVVTVVLGLARYSTGLGRVSAAQGKVFGFLGETIGDQLPPVVQVPPSVYGLSALFRPDQMQVPSAASVAAHYGTPSATELFAEPADAVAAALPHLMYIPKAWAMYFMDRKSPKAAHGQMQALMATLETADQADDMEGLSLWCRAACLRVGNQASERRTGQMAVAWTTPALADRKFTQWSHRRLSPFRLMVPALDTGPTFPASAAIAASTGSATPPTEKNFSEMEHRTIRSAASLSRAQYEVLCPPIYTAMLTEGRTKAKVDTVLQSYLAPDLDSDHPVHIFVSSDLVADFKDLRFGYGGDLSYETCHRGITPFAVAAVSQEQASFRRRAQDRANRATFITQAELAILETRPSPCPRTYDGLLRMLLTYSRFLEVTCGPFCSHLLEVAGIRKVLCQRVAYYESMAPADVTQILWSIFADARSFFSSSTDDDDVPKSMLHLDRTWLATGSVKATTNCPVTQLLGLASPSLPIPYVGAGATAAEETPFQRMPVAGGAGGKNLSPVPEFVDATKSFVTAHPEATFQEMMRLASLKYKTAKLGASGSCLDYGIFGRCTNPSCTYKHAPQVISAERVKEMLPIISQAMLAYKAKHR